jgi:osmotically-inducible protein OsmY
MRVGLLFTLILTAVVQQGVAMDNIAREVPHELLLVPGYTVFDWLAYRVDQAKVTLVGAVVREQLKRDAESAVRKIEGVESVENDIEVLPDSDNDDKIRMGVLRTIQGDSRYLISAVQAIHIIEKNGEVTLVGAVPDQLEKQRTEILANHVMGVKKVTNDLVIQK